MSHLFLIVVIGLLGGIAIGLQAPLASMINQRLGVLESVFVVHLGGLIAVSVPLICSAAESLVFGNRFPGMRSAPVYSASLSWAQPYSWCRASASPARSR